jgi:transposase
MEISTVDIDRLISAPEFSPEQQGAEFWYQAYLEQRQHLEQTQQQLASLEQELSEIKETVRKLSQRSSENSSQPSSQDGPKKKSKPKNFVNPPQGKKRGPKYGHPGSTRNGFDQVDHVDHIVELVVETCPACGAVPQCVADVAPQHHQIAELVPKLVEVWDYHRPLCECSACEWRGYAPLPLGCREDFSYGAMLSSLVGWLGYGGHLSWSKQRFLVQTIFQIPLSEGSLSKMHHWFCQRLYPSYEQGWESIQKPGVRCVDETSYRLNGVNYWMWVATSKRACMLFLAPSRSSEEVKSLLGENFSGILSSDCWSAYSPVSASVKQKCLAHIERELKAMASSHLKANRIFAQQVFPILHQARDAYNRYHQGEWTQAQLESQRLVSEAQLASVLDHPPSGGWAFDAQTLANRFKKHWHDWFTFLSHPHVKPDNNDAERALRPLVVHRKVSGGARSHWGGQLVAMMFSFLETMRLQGNNPVAELFERLVNVGRAPPAWELALSD